MNSYRVSGRGRVDASRSVSFTFDGKTYRGVKGDTVASALLANGVHLMGRSFKYHRPRGPVAAGSEEPNALIGTRRSAGRFEPNTRATVQEIWDGLETTSQNKYPSLKFDIGAVNDMAYMLFSAGFYYKTFMWPKSFWNKVYEPFIRAAAGLGVSPTEEDPDTYASRNLHCDVLIVGAGPAGLAAARAAAVEGLKVVLVDENAEAGGTLLSEPQAKIDGKPAWVWLADEVEALKDRGVKVMTRTTAIAYYHQNMIGLCEKLTDHLETVPKDVPRERLWRVRARQVVLAQGALEKPLVFHGNDRPGVMLAGSAQTYLNRYGVKVGNRPVVVTSHDSAWYAAFDLHGAGAPVQAIVDTRAKVREELVNEARALGIPVKLSHTVTATSGRLRVKSVHVNPVNGSTVGAGQDIACDAVLMSGGWTPSLHLFSHTQGKIAWDDERTTFLPALTNEDCVIAGAGRGLWGIEAALKDGAERGREVVAALGKTANVSSHAVDHDRIGSGVSHTELPSDRDAGKAKAFVDYQNDVTAKDLRLAVREGMRSIEHVKRYTTNGMATDQGKMSNINGLNIAAEALGKRQPEVGLTTFRPPYTPTTFGAFAGYHRGAHFEVTRKTQIDSWSEAHGAVYEPVGQWRRAWYFPKSGEDMDAAVRRECRAVRQSVGIFDASTLGKIEVVGPDAVEFMNRMYTNPWTKLAAGRCRYGLLLGDDGFIRDDGVIGRMTDDRFHVTTTTGGAARVLNMMEDYLQTEWPDLNVWLTSTTEQWSTIALNGPNAAKLLAPLVEGVELTEEAFPHMSCAECTVAGMPARLFRVSFTGEIGFEVNVPAPLGRKLWEILWESGQQYGITPYGTETMHVLRAEKGYIIVGQDTDGTVTPYDAAMGWAVGKNKPDFVGKRGLARPDLVAKGRRHLVGLLTEDRSKLEEGAQIVFDPKQPIPMKMVGHVTSSYHSDAVGQPIALALVEGGHERMGETVYIPMLDRTIAAKITGMVFVDPENTRLKI
ncbi:sarcosine oxidase subunit alpha [Agrobacterium pusense]|uniref:Sarcosine oxidase, alpha subunit n=1 Tax=Agrobacterium pusense TaxID=648995 RepID=U4PYV5_9HYPH|nr:sarcosine oxidase subunit alpha [Agrobacterium pusense]OOO23936.1 sarcosine oxidase subunit alpha [Agrobacterium pusense]WFN87875.1 sarcosine oxidase subunit alpha [Agrobacterium pusense]WKD44708.1 sarcosine oxidase subunit alpha [Agrobacterium pusense]CDI10199.1 sarcosine oxidase, alpha subunit [Agrobacterium pusense]SDE81988.1 sarcosine oxidase subunit alpha [Agrobacterium pusense]